MIFSEPTARHGGMTLWVDEHARDQLKNTCLDLAEHAKRIRKDGYVFSLACDIADAKMHQSGAGVVDGQSDDKNGLYKTTHNWIMILAQLALLRTALNSTGKRRAAQHEGMVSELEKSVFSALEKMLGKDSEDTIDWYKRLVRRDLHESIFENLLGSRVSMFLQLNPKERKETLYQIVRSFVMVSIDPRSPIGLSTYDFDKHSWASLEGLPAERIAL